MAAAAPNPHPATRRSTAVADGPLRTSSNIAIAPTGRARARVRFRRPLAMSWNRRACSPVRWPLRFSSSASGVNAVRWEDTILILDQTRGGDTLVPPSADVCSGEPVRNVVLDTSNRRRSWLLSSRDRRVSSGRLDRSYRGHICMTAIYVTHRSRARAQEGFRRILDPVATGKSCTARLRDREADRVAVARRPPLSRRIALSAVVSPGGSRRDRRSLG